MSRIIVALVGPAQSGKSTLAESMPDYGFKNIETSDIIHRELVRVFGDQSFSRTDYREMGYRLRSEIGARTLVERTLDIDAERISISGIRNLLTMHTLIEFGAYGIGVIARPEVRYKRACKIKGKAAPLNFADFLRDELAEESSDDVNGSQVTKVLECIDPENIIDTSDKTPRESIQELGTILGRMGSIDKAIMEGSYGN